MKEVQFGWPAERPTDREGQVRHGQEAGPHPTPAEIMAQIGCVVAACLGLALVMHVFVAALGIE